MPRLNIADRYGSPRYTSIGQTQPDGATVATRKMTRWIDDTNRRRWGELPRGMAEWDYGPGRRPWGAPANSWVLEQERKDILDRHGSDQAISDWITRTEDAKFMGSAKGCGKAPDSHDGWNNGSWGASTSLKKDGWHETSEASSRLGYHPLSQPSDSEDQSHGWGGFTKRSRAKEQKGRSDWQKESGCWAEHGWGEECDCVTKSGCGTESARDNDDWGEAPVPHRGWKESGWDASTGIDGQWHEAQGPSSFGDVPVSEHFDLEDQSDGWGFRPKYSRKEAPEGMSSWENESEHGGTSEWGKELGWDVDSAWTEKTRSLWGNANDAWINRHQSQQYDFSSGYLLTPSETIEPSAETSWTKQDLKTQRRDEEVKGLRRQLAQKKRKNAELGRRLYTLENEQIDPGSVVGITDEAGDTDPAAFQRVLEAPIPPYTPLVPDTKPKATRKAATSAAETEHFDPPPETLPKTTLDSIASSLPPGKFRTRNRRDLNTLTRQAGAHYDRYSGVIRDKVHGTRPVFFTMDQTATFGDILHNWETRRGIQDDALILYYRGEGWGNGWVVALDSTVSMEGINAKHIELDVTAGEELGGW